MRVVGCGWVSCGEKGVGDVAESPRPLLRGLFS